MRIICHGLRNEDFPVEFINHEISLGAEDSNVIAVKADGVAGCHAFLMEAGDDLFIRDNGSTGGTFLNHKKVHGKKKVSSGDIIEIGSKEEGKTRRGEKTAHRKLTAGEREKLVETLTREMKSAAAKLEFEQAAFLRDRIKKIREGKIDHE